MNAKRSTKSRIRSSWTAAAIVALGGLSLTMGGCDNAGEGLFTGAALGAVTGLIIGSMNGEAGEGAALGAVIGGAGGAIVGDQNQRNRENAYISGRGSYRHNHHGHDHYRNNHHDDWWND